LKTCAVLEVADGRTERYAGILQERKCLATGERVNESSKWTRVSHIRTYEYENVLESTRESRVAATELSWRNDYSLYSY
jgi:hypothetical protein